MTDAELEPFDRTEWRNFSRVVSEIWTRLQRVKPRTARCYEGRGSRRAETAKCTKGLDLAGDTLGTPEPPPWIEERIQRYAARIAAGLLIFEDVAIADVRRQEGRDKGGRPAKTP